MNSLLNKFQNVTIQNDTRISELDKAYCEKQEKMYQEAQNVLQNTLKLFKEIYETYPKSANGYGKEGYIEEYEDIRPIEDRIKKVKNGFISNIIYHFQKEYNVTLDSSEIVEKYNTEVTYQNIVDEIFEQLGGFNFKEKAINELIEKCKATIYSSDKIIIKKNKLSIADFVYWDKYSWEGKQISYNDNNVTPLFKALSYFETESTETLSYYNNIYSELRQGEKENDIFSKYELGYNKVKSLKIFKNGKIDIEFESMQQAEEFARKFLKYNN